MKKEMKAIVPLLLIAVILGGFILASGETAAQEATVMETVPEVIPEPVEISHEEAAEHLEDGDITYTLTEDERELVIGVVAAEARGESLEGMMAVAQSIRDRAITRGQTVTEVCLAPHQYAAPYTGEVSDRLVDAVMFVFDEGHSALEYPTTHFYQHETIEAPDWTYNLTCRGSIGDHTFFG